MGTTVDAGAAVAALESNLWSMWRQFGLGDGCRLVDEPELLRFETPVAQLPYNSVMRTRLDDGDGDEVIAAVLAGCRARGVPPVWLVHPTSRPRDLGRRLERHGLAMAEPITGMVAPSDALPDLAGEPPLPDGVTVEEVPPGGEGPYLELLAWRYDLPSDAVAVLRSIMATAGFGVPGSGNRMWIARRGDQVLSKVGLHQRDGVGGVYGVVTRPEARGLGLARRLTLVALDAARRDGAALAVLHSTPAAVSLYRALGFAPTADFQLHAEPGTLHL